MKEKKKAGWEGLSRLCAVQMLNVMSESPMNERRLIAPVLHRRSIRQCLNESSCCVIYLISALKLHFIFSNLNWKNKWLHIMSQRCHSQTASYNLWFVYAVALPSTWEQSFPTLRKYVKRTNDIWRSFSLHPSIIYTDLRVARDWKPPRLTLGERQGWRTETFTPTGNLAA